MDKEVMKGKIKKLLALAGNNPSDEESYSALMKAQALMAQYKIEEGEISQDKKEECVTVETRFRYSNGSSDTYLSKLASILADNFCCVNYVSKCYGSKSRNICFMGLKKDVDTIIEAMTIANDAIYRGYNKVYKKMCKEYHVDSIPARIFNPAKVGYIKGYLRGLKEVLDAQKEQIQEWGLVLVAPQEAKDFLEGLSTFSVKSISANDTYYDEGYNDGKKFNMNKKLDGEGQRLLEN